MKKLQEQDDEKKKRFLAIKRKIERNCKLLNLTNGRIDRMGQLRGKTKEVYNEYRGLYDVSSQITKETNTKNSF